MEVHQHTHTSRKKWTNYFWEFLMLFLAVFCGFLAEYKLEHMIEQQREKEYMKSLAADVKKDIAILNTAIETNDLQIKGKDSMVLLIASGILPPDKATYFYDLHWRYLGYPTEITFSKRTLTQLLNAGGLRLIRNKKVSDAIAEYATGVEYLEKSRQQAYIEYSYKALDASQKLIDVQYVRALPDKDYIRAPYGKPVLRDTGPEVIKDFAFMLEMDKQNSIIFTRTLRKYKKEAEALLDLLNKEYHTE